jgi:hypothetical protein
MGEEYSGERGSSTKCLGKDNLDVVKKQKEDRWVEYHR